MTMLLFVAVIVVASLIGGASSALFVKNKSARRLLLVGFAIISFVGLVPLLPFIMGYLSVSLNYIVAAIMMVTVCVTGLSVAGIRFSNAIRNKAGRVILKVLFWIVLVLAVLVTIVTPLISNYLVSRLP